MKVYVGDIDPMVSQYVKDYFEGQGVDVQLEIAQENITRVVFKRWCSSDTLLVLVTDGYDERVRAKFGSDSGFLELVEDQRYVVYQGMEALKRLFKVDTVGVSVNTPKVVESVVTKTVEVGVAEIEVEKDKELEEVKSNVDDFAVRVTAEKARLEVELANAHTTNQKLVEEVELLRGVKLECEKYKAANGRLESELKDTRVRLSRAEDTASTKGDLAELQRGKINQLGEECKELSEKIVELEYKVGAVEKEKVVLEEVQKDLKEKLGEEKASVEILKERLAGSERAREEIGEQLKVQVGLVEGLQEQVKGVSVEKDRLIEEVQKAGMREKALQDALEVSNGRAKELREELETVSSREKELESKLENASSREKELESKLENASSREKELESKLENASDKEKELRLKLGVSDGKEGELQELLEKSSNREKELQVQLEEASRREESVRLELEKKQLGVLAELEKEQNQRIALEKELEDLREECKRVGGARGDYELIKKELESVRAELDGVSETREALKNAQERLKNVQAEFSLKETHITSLKQEIEALKGTRDNNAQSLVSRVEQLENENVLLREQVLVKGKIDTGKEEELVVRERALDARERDLTNKEKDLANRETVLVDKEEELKTLEQERIAREFEVVQDIVESDGGNYGCFVGYRLIGASTCGSVREMYRYVAREASRVQGMRKVLVVDSSIESYIDTELKARGYLGTMAAAQSYEIKGVQTSYRGVEVIKLDIDRGYDYQRLLEVAKGEGYDEVWLVVGYVKLGEVEELISVGQSDITMVLNITPVGLRTALLEEYKFGVSELVAMGVVQKEQEKALVALSQRYKVSRV